MNAKFLSLLAAAALASGLSACGGTAGGRTITDGSNNPVQIGGDTASAGGPGSPGWPKEPAVSGR